MQSGFVAIIGRPNAGKSSLLNAVYNQKIAYVGKRPGMTKMLNFFEVDERYLVVDVPGYGFANRSKNEIVEFAAMMDDFFSDCCTNVYASQYFSTVCSNCYESW